MKKILPYTSNTRIKSLLFILLGIVCATLTFAQTKEVVINKATVSPVEDGIVDPVWAQAVPFNIALPYRTETPTLGTEGQSWWKGLWTDKGIYILVNVTDNVFSPPYLGTDPGTNWMYDKVEIYFDCNYIKKDGLGADRSQGHYCFAPVPTENMIKTGLPASINFTGSTYCYKLNGQSYVAEYFIPFSELLDKDGLTLDKTAPIGFDITVIDNDVKSPIRNRMVWANNGVVDENWNNMDGAGQMILEGCACPNDTLPRNDYWSNQNLIKNWNFNADLTSWDNWVDSSVPGATLPTIVDGVVKMTTGKASDGNYWHYQFNQLFLEAEANIPYILKFKSWSSIPKSNRVDFEDSPPFNDYIRYGASNDAQAIDGRSEWQYNTTTEPQWFTFHVVFDQIKPTTVQKIQWMLSNANATTYLDSILLIKEEDYNNPLFLTVSTKDITMTTGLESKAMFDITSNTSWQVSSDQAWVTFDTSAGKGNKTITLTALANPAYTMREATITVSANGLSPKTFRIIQPAKLQIPVTLPVTAGKLSSLMSAAELAQTITLTLSGTIDARDFKTMRDKMPLLAEVDLSKVKIIQYTGTEGTAGTGITFYPGNTLPENAFYTPSGPANTTLKMIKLPASLSTIGKEAFTYCTGLTNITLPATVTTIQPYAFSSCSALSNVILPPSTSVYSIGAYAFQNCSSLQSLYIPYMVSYIGEFAFNNCGAIINVDNGNTFYSSQDGILYNKNKTRLISCPISKAGKMIIPSTVNSIENSAFSSCRYLRSVTIPASVTSISNYVFSQCIALDTIYALSPIPVDLSSSAAVFSGINQPEAMLFVPNGSVALYASANQWKDFTIKKINGLSLFSHDITLDAAAGSQSTVQLYCDTTWTAKSTESWLTVNPGQGLGNAILTFTAQANPFDTVRTAQVIVSTFGINDQTITITQQGQPLTSKTLNITAGGLLSSLTTKELNSITMLTLSGTIDARDFRIMRDQMPLLETIDISSATIAAYTGKEGTCGYIDYTYPANVLPDNSFRNPTGLGKNTLKAINLPLSVKSIGKEAFLFCYGLTSLTIPEGVTTIGNQAFSSCKSLTSIILPSTLTSIEVGAFQNCHSLLCVTIPASVTNIGEFAFNYCNALIAVEEANTKYSGQNGILFNKAKTSLISCPTSITGGYTIPASVTSIKSSAFSFCDKLTSITIPASVTSISNYAFSQCTGLRAINVISPMPVNLSSAADVFQGVDKIKTVLCVPFGSKSLYAAANQWKDFNTIMEIYGFKISSDVLKLNAYEQSEITVQVFCDSTWTVNLDQSWLSVSQSNGIGGGTLTFTAQANPLNTDRQAIVKINSPGKEAKTITVVQSSVTGVNQLENDNQISIYPNPTSGKVKLVAGSNTQNEYYLTVTDITGKTILKQLIQGKEQSIDLKGNPPGVYFINTGLKDSKVQKIVLTQE